MPRILIVEDDDSMRDLFRQRLEGSYEIIDTGEATQALTLALQHKPDCILLDLRMSEFSGFELCQTFSSLSFTQLIPIFVITGEPGTKYKNYCLNLGAKEYFEKPVDFARLKERLAAVLDGKSPERRREVRIRMAVILRLRGADVLGKAFEQVTATEDVSASGFLCPCSMALEKGAIVEVSLLSGAERYVGQARAVHAQSPDTPWQRYGFEFLEKPHQWVLE